MTTDPRPDSAAEKIPCNVCQKEIPISEAENFEAQDYVEHFCGLECYSTWKQLSDALDQENKKSQH